VGKQIEEDILRLYEDERVRKKFCEVKRRKKRERADEAEVAEEHDDKTEKCPPHAGGMTTRFLF
jgi:hypothetical protein